MLRAESASVDTPDTRKGLLRREIVDELCGRSVVCLTALFVAALLANVHAPFLEPSSLTTTTLSLLAQPAGRLLSYIHPRDAVDAFWHVSTWTTLLLVQPVLLKQVLDILRPPDIGYRRWRLHGVVAAMLVSFSVGLIFGYVYLNSVLIPELLRWNPAVPEVKWQYVEYMRTVSDLLFGFSLICEAPALLAGLVWLRIVTREQLAADRLYALLAAFVIGAWATPTPDVMNQTVVAGIIYVSYEFGLLLAYLFPAPDEPDEEVQVAS